MLIYEPIKNKKIYNRLILMLNVIFLETFHIPEDIFILNKLFIINGSKICQILQIYIFLTVKLIFH